MLNSSQNPASISRRAFLLLCAAHALSPNTKAAAHRKPVQSSSLRSIGYNKSRRTLEIEFRNGTIYHYYEVPPGIHKALLNAPSKGRYFHTYIRPRFPYKKSPAKKP